ncbi:MAG: hypothetical protein A2X56_03740 [Nitrospirae bacterium GWC2_57_13]|jgi:putative ABC transport system permease protein|nr:MAG: hypothetical protein A2072_06585 [Nitrospirae bacterium GWC1_57_7]OGW29360.1 MAG: hypothetical protein A2X56_03740 [Nitrospirae bacterium GWC2_57_13]OGW43390.1 MAG: hypothetical protein A2X57_04970 [Nitrospirae bacterium GWD2_57_8]HAR39504.1 hypothetical protein [Porphyromonadaceae bacterium]HAS52922.1 hypothetical protein [Nitrospiraceae bacterium]
MKNRFSLFSFALKNIRRKAVRSTMLASAIMLLTASIVFAVSFITRVHSGISLMTSRLGADIMVVPTGSRGAAEEVLLENKVKSFYMDGSVLDRVRNIEGVEEVTAQTYLVTLSALCCSVPESIVVAFDQKSDFIVRPWLTEKLGRPLKKGEAIVGHESAFNITVGLVEIDSMLFGNVFRMVGVLDKTGTGLDNAIFISDENITDILRSGTAGIKPGQVSIAFVKVRKGYDPKLVANAVENNILEADAVMRKDIGKRIIQTLRDVSGIFTAAVVLAALLSGFLAWTVFSAVANERAREVGIMRAIGARESDVVRLFLWEVFLIGIAGSVLGIIGGTALSVMLARSFILLKDLAGDLGIAVRALIAVAGLIGGVAVCVIGALSPLRRIKKLEPLGAMKEA